MQSFERVRSVVVRMPDADINTDEIVPARFMSRPRVDYGRYFFHDRRFEPDGSARDGFVLNDPRFAGAQILLAGRNFGCGSSREHAVFVLADYGIRVVLATSLADIFHANCLNNGVLPIALGEPSAQALFDLLDRQPQAPLEVDLALQRVSAPSGESFRFDVDPFHKQSLLRGVDAIDRTLEFKAAIERFEAGRKAQSRGIPQT